MRYPAIITKEGKKTLASFPDISSWVVSLHNRPQGSRGEGCSGSKCLPGLQSNF